MNIILLESAEVDGDGVRLSGRRADHIVKVLRARVGDTVRVGIVNGKTGHGTIKSISGEKPRTVELTVGCHDDPPAAAQIDLLLALPRPIMLKRILSHVAALGVGHVYLVNAARVEKSFWSASLLQDEGWREYFLLGLEQSVDTIVPTLSVHRGFKPFVENAFPELAARYQHMFLAHPEESRQLVDMFGSHRGRVLIAIGPEGGWSEYEVESLKQAGFAGCSIGPRILRVETAVTVLHAMISVLATCRENR